MRLTRQTGHALRILVDCAQSDPELIKASVIAKRLDITQQNVLKIVHILSHAGFIAAVRGRHGGIRLARPPEEIRVGDVVRVTEVTSVEIEDDGVRSSGRGASQPIRGVLDEALEAFISVLDQHTLSDMAATARRSSDAAKRQPAKGGVTAASRSQPRPVTRG